MPKALVQKLISIQLVTLSSMTLSSAALAEDASFTLGMQLLAPIELTLNNSLSFADTTSGQDTVISTAPDNANAVIFSATGEPNRAVTGSVVESSVLMTTGTGTTSDEQITVDSFQTGGTMDASGQATFDGSGQLDDLRIGASAHVESEDVPGAYSGNATFRLTYN